MTDKNTIIIKFEKLISQNIELYFFKHPYLYNNFEKDDFYGDCAIGYINAIDKLFSDGKIYNMDENYLKNFLSKVIKIQIIKMIRKETASMRNIFKTCELRDEIIKCNESISPDPLETILANEVYTIFKNSLNADDMNIIKRSMNGEKIEKQKLKKIRKQIMEILIKEEI